MVDADGFNRRSREVLAGGLLVLLLMASLAHGLFGIASAEYAGMAGWCAAALLAGRLRGAARIQVLGMLGVGTVGMVWGAAAGNPPSLGRVFSANQQLLAMLVGVTFLRLVALPNQGRSEALPKGARSLWRTLFGVHFFGAVINLSAVMIVGERQAASKPLSRLQAIVLSRGFSAAAYWSPFFAAMGVALTYAPGSQMVLLMSVGFVAAMISLVIVGYGLSRDSEVSTYRGYPMHFETLIVPGLLAVAVVLLHELWPHIRVLVWVALLSPLLAIAMVFGREGRTAIFSLGRHVTSGLPQMSSELVLFLAAGVLAVGISSYVGSMELQVLPEHFGPTEASLLLGIMVLLAAAGVHPVISISVSGGLLMPIASDPSLVGMVFLMAWSLGVCVSPLSGMHLAMQGRFQVPATRFFGWNLSYIAAMLCVDVGLLHIYHYWGTII